MVGYLHSTEHPPVFHSVHFRTLLRFPRWRFSSSLRLCHCQCLPLRWLLLVAPKEEDQNKKMKPPSAPRRGWGTHTRLWATSAALRYSHFKSQHSNHLLSSLAAWVPAQTVLVKQHSASNLFSLAHAPDIMKYLSWGRISEEDTRRYFATNHRRKGLQTCHFQAVCWKSAGVTQTRVFQKFSLKPRKQR